MKRIFLLTALLVFSMVTISTAREYSQTLVIKDHAIVVKWQQRNNKLTVKGFVKGGLNCRQLNVAVFMQNSSDSGLIYLEDAMHNYKPKAGKRYEATSAVYQKSRYRDDWHISDVDVYCIE